MSLKIRRATVLGAGVMGAQIAAHLAAAGIRTYLLDLPADAPPEDPKMKKFLGKNFRNSRSQLALQNLKMLKPAPLYSEDVLKLVIPGNFEDDFSVISDSDWVVEVVVERLDIKRDIHQRIKEYLPAHAIVTTNTSGIPLSSIVEGFPEDYIKRFFGTHFFNPPRYMRLLELIPHANTDDVLFADFTQFASAVLGKGVVVAADTVNFIGNRIGTFVIVSATKYMEELGLNVETVDLLTGKLMGRPPSATFRTMDVVGLDTFAHVAKNVFDKATNDPYREKFELSDWLLKLVESGALGQKSGSVGCYKKTKDEKGKTKILAFRPDSGNYEEQSPASFPWAAEAAKIPSLAERMNFVIKHDDAGAQFVWRVLRDTFSYSALLVEEVAQGLPKSLDEAIKWGFNFAWGPFELWQAMGFSAIRDRIKSEGSLLPDWCNDEVDFYQPLPWGSEWTVSGPESQRLCGTNKYQKVLKQSYNYSLPTFRNQDDKRVVKSNEKASLVDIGDGVCALVFHSKMNTIDMNTLKMGQDAVAHVARDFDGLVIANDADHFSAGANLKYLRELIEKKDFAAVDSMIREFQGTCQLIKYAPFPTVACPHGLTLGGGCEVALHASRRVVSAETYAGLVELGVGLIPAGGGTKELALRAYQAVRKGEKADPMPFLQRAFLLIGMAKVSGSGFEAINSGIFPDSSVVSISRDHQIDKAKHLVLQMVRENYSAPIPELSIPVAGDTGIHSFKMMLYNMLEGYQVSEYDAYLAEQVATVLCGGSVSYGQKVSEQFLLDLERRVFVDLCKQEKTVARIDHMLKTGKPLRN